MMEQQEIDALFREYRRTGDAEIRNKLVEQYFYIAEILADRKSVV